MNLSDYVLKFLLKKKVKKVFLITGGAISFMVDAFSRNKKINYISVGHEQGAAMMADAYSRLGPNYSCTMVTSGPGATNLLTGIACSYFDSIPSLHICGQVNTYEQQSSNKSTSKVRQVGFQETDIVNISKPITKFSYKISDANEIRYILEKSYHLATSGRPGPVLIDIPKDVQFAKGNYIEKEKIIIQSHRLFEPEIFKNDEKINEVVDLISKAKKPIFYIGGGCINSGPKASALVSQFVEMTKAPATMTLMGLGVIGSSHPNSLGMLGMHGMYEANMAMHECDVMINIGARFDDRVTGRLDAFSPNSKKIHIDIDESNINKTIKVDVPVVGDVTNVLNQIIQTWKDRKLTTNSSDLKIWWDKINNWKKIDCLNFSNDEKEIKPQYAIQRLYELTKDKKTFITTEVGQHQMWAAQFYKFEKPNRWLTSGGLGTMGYGFPAAIGAQVANPDALVIDIAGDASILMNIQEMSTAVQYRLPVKIFILNNEYMGMVRQWQELLHGGRYSESYTDSLPDFVKLAESYKAVGLRAKKPEELDDVINEMINTDKTVIADIWVSKEENCFPMIQSGSAHNEMVLSKDQKQDESSAEKGKILV